MAAIPLPYAEINQALRDVTDTFANNPITYKHFAPTTVPEFNEGGQNPEFTDYVLDAFVEDITKDLNESQQGGTEAERISILMNFDYLVEQGIGTGNNKVLFDKARDIVLWRGFQYKVVEIQYDGLLNQKYTIVVVIAERSNYEKV